MVQEFPTISFDFTEIGFGHHIKYKNYNTHTLEFES